MVSLSVVIITYNEERNIERCLKSVQDFADEVVVLDSFSTDRTKEICKKYGVRFYQHKFDGHIQQKNRALSYASFAYVLQLDADEAPDEQLKAEIIRVKQDFKADGYTFNRLTNYCGQWIKHSGWYPDRKLRLFDSSKGKWTGTNPHDRLELKKGSSIKHLKGDLLHYSFYTIEEHIQTIDKFSSIAAQQRFEKGKKPFVLKLIFSPLSKFLSSYIFKGGFWDGYYGWVISINSAHSSFLKQVKLRELWKKQA